MSILSHEAESVLKFFVSSCTQLFEVII